MAHLCKECKASTLVVDSAHTKLAQAAYDALPLDHSPHLAPLPSFQDDRDLNNPAAADTTQLPLWPVSESDVAYLHHTSGTSTGLPKLIPQTHRAAVGVLPTFHDGQDKATFTTTPLYHGGVADCFRAWTSGAMIWLFPGGDAPISSSNILKSLGCAERATYSYKTPKVKYFSSVPFVLQMMAAEKEGLQILRDMDLVGVGGAALTQSVGDDLTQHGVNLVSRFGSAECGFLMSSHRAYGADYEWQYLRSEASPHLNFEPQADGLSELIILPSWPHMAKRNRDDGSYATADLFEPHPTILDAWKYHSRADSQLTLITGKKFDPASLEAAMATSPLLSDVLIFGNGQQTPGALLFRSCKSSNMANGDLIDTLWPMIERLNAEGQGHTRLSKSTLIVMPSEATGLEKSSKGAIMRGQAEQRYKAEITQAYEADPGVLTADGQDYVSDKDMPSTVLEIIKNVIGTREWIPDDADLFSFGVDSVACMQIRSLLQNRVPIPGVTQLPINIVYDCGTITKISQYLISIRNGQSMEKEDEIQLMWDLVSQYSTAKAPPNFISETHRNSNSGLNEEVVVLTGATGALGAHILSLLRSSPRVSEIHCLIRAASPLAASERISKSLLARNKTPLDTTPSKIICHPYKLSDPTLGLSPALYTKLADSANVIIHAAWAVNFSARLSSFKKDHIAGLRNLIDLALASPHSTPARFLFCSSTASVLGPNATSPIPDRISHDPLSASPLGYSRSKWVAEAICESAYLKTRMAGRIGVLRIGQLCGDTESGIWNVTEAWPLMLSSVKVTGSLPDLKGEKLSWLPVDIAAMAVVEIALDGTTHRYGTLEGANKNTPVYHLLNPSTQTTWSDLLRWIQQLSPDITIVPAAQWVHRLENLTGEDAKHPARKLVGLWRDAYCREDIEAGDGKGDVVFEMDQTKKVVSAMRDVGPVTEEMVGKIWEWVGREMMNGSGGG